jgi:hypothetical protein
VTFSPVIKQWGFISVVHYLQMHFCGNDS